VLALVIGGEQAREAVAAVLSPHGFSVESAESPPRTPRPRTACHVVIVDWDAPGDGAAFSRALGGDAAFEEAPLLALCTDQTPARLREIFAAGAIDVLRLPDDAARLVARALHAADAGSRGTVDANARLYRRLFEHNPLPMCLFDDQTLQFLAVSDGAVRQYGWSREEMLGMTLRDIRPPECVAAFEQAVHQPDPAFLTTRHRRKDGSEFISRGILQRLTEEAGRVRFAVSRDVTEELRAAEAQRRTRADYQELVERSADGVLTHRPFPDGTIAYANPAFVAFLGYRSSEELLGRPVLDVVHPDDREQIRGRIHSIVTTSKPSSPHAIRFIGADGNERWAETRGMAVGYESAPAITVIARDLTERRRAEEALRRSEERFARIFDTNPAAISITRVADRKFIDVNRRFTDLTGYTRDEVIGHTGVELRLWQDPQDRERVLETMRRDGPREVEIRSVDKSGATHDVLMSVVPIEVNGEPHLLAIAVDITERKRLDEQLRHAHKMEAIGRLAGGIAHDFNNLLTGIRGYSELLLQQLPTGTDGRDGAQHILRAALRAASLTSQLLAFTRREPTRGAVLVLDDEVRQLASMLRRIIGSDVALELGLRAGDARVHADAGQLEQVILNLAVNARDAMPNGGQLTIATAAVPDASGRGTVRLTISDTGGGVSEEVRARMFEPFYTTKEVGRGTGLGLSIVYGIVEQSGGTIRVESAPGRGTSFHISLPRVDEPLAVPAPAAPRTAPGGNETILFVEDDEDVRDFVQFVLAGAGYRVLVAEDGVRALEVAEASPRAIDLLLTDLVMPRLNGHDLSTRLTGLRPTVRVMHISGYPGIAGRPSEASRDTVLLQKPFSAEELLRAVRTALDGPHASRGA
jgi:two-component system cell cycle sensor histidine kinase/response regulator CckA